MMERLEHANLCVHDIDAVVRFLTTAFPDFTIRKDAIDPDGSRWERRDLHALNQAKAQEPKRGTPYKSRPGLNHLAYEVNDVESLRARLKAAGYRVLDRSECSPLPQTRLLL